MFDDYRVRVGPVIVPEGGEEKKGDGVGEKSGFVVLYE